MSGTRVPVELDPVSETLLISLWCRVRARDPDSIRIANELDFDFSTIDRTMPDSFKLASAERARRFDEETRRFLAAHPQATVVNLGAGLDDPFRRVDNGQVRWIDVDVPQVIALRARFLPERGRCCNLAASLADGRWMEEVSSSNSGLFFISCSVMPYLAERELRQLIVAMASRYPGSEFLFDAYTRLQLALHNATAPLAKASRMESAVHDARRMLRWSNRIALVGQQALFEKEPLDPEWPWRMRMMGHVFRRLGFWNMVRLRFG